MWQKCNKIWTVISPVEYKQPKICTCFEFIFWPMPLSANIDSRLCINHSYSWEMSKFLVDISRAYKIEFCEVNIADIWHPRNIKECLPMLRKSDRMVSSYKISCWNRDVPCRKWWDIKGEYCTCKREKMSVFLLGQCLRVNAATHSQHKEIWMGENIQTKGLLYRRGVQKRAVFCLTHRVIGNR